MGKKKCASYLEWLNNLLKEKVKLLRFLNSEERSTVIEGCAVYCFILKNGKTSE